MDTSLRPQRLRQARKRHFGQAKAAALSLGIPYGTYSGHETGSRGIKDDELKLYSRRFKVPLPWLSFGIGAIDDEVSSILPVVGRVGAGAQIDVAAEQAPSEYESVEVKVQLPLGAISFEVHGDSMWPRYEDGDLVVCMEDGVPLDELPDGTEAAVRTIEGTRYLKKIQRTGTIGLYNLESHNAPVIRDVRIAWASDVMAIIPRRKWRSLTLEEKQILETKRVARR